MNEPQFQDIEPETPICVDCTHLVGRRNYFETAAQWKCAFKDNVTSISKDLVSGMNVYSYQFSTCYSCRQDEQGCGPTGKWFQKYEVYQPPARPLFGRKPAEAPSKSVDELLGELDI